MGLVVRQLKLIGIRSQLDRRRMVSSGEHRTIWELTLDQASLLTACLTRRRGRSRSSSGGVKGIVEGELLFPCRVDPQLITRRCHDGVQWDSVLLWPNRVRKDIQ